MLHSQVTLILKTSCYKQNIPGGSKNFTKTKNNPENPKVNCCISTAQRAVDLVKMQEGAHSTKMDEVIARESMPQIYSHELCDLS